MKREFKFRSLITNIMMVLGLIFILGAAFFQFFTNIDIAFYLLIVSIILIIFSMYRILTFYVYIGEYAISVNISILRPKVSIPWREISDIEINDNSVIIVFRSAGRTRNLLINKFNFEINQWETFVDNIIEQWKENPENT